MKKCDTWKRVYPPGRLAAAVVWLFDRLPNATRQQVLKSYWWDEELRAIKTRARARSTELEGEL